MQDAEKNKNTQLESEANANAICGLCCKPVIEDRDEALLCEEICDRWLHCYCAGVTEMQYEALQDSTLPFLCSICSQVKQAAVIKDMQEKIGLFIAEVTELRSTVSVLKAQIASQKSTNGEAPKADATENNMWTEVVCHGKTRSVQSEVVRCGGRRGKERRIASTPQLTNNTNRNNSRSTNDQNQVQQRCKLQAEQS